MAGSLIAVYTEAQQMLLAELETVIGEPNESRRRRRIRNLIDTHERTMSELTDTTRNWWTTEIPVAHRLGATDFAAGRVAPIINRNVIESFARRTWDDIASRLEQIDDDTRRSLRNLARSGTRSGLLESKTAQQAGRDMAREAAKEGIWSVRYHGGAHHTMRDYADTVIRTTTATAYNDGALTQAKAEGIGWVEYADGSDCGVNSHDDPQKADGLIVKVDTVVMLSHPRCRRALLPAPFAQPLETADRSIGPERPPGPATIPTREPRTPRVPRTARQIS
ncbi:phage minor capsid protein [Mycobacterium sp.]|uniref:phage minor capsid protein n=1 Tax=Mycobacterium sp. TaxID=1785 RepID=UPI003A8A9F52